VKQQDAALAFVAANNPKCLPSRVVFLSQTACSLLKDFTIHILAAKANYDARLMSERTKAAFCGRNGSRPKIRHSPACRASIFRTPLAGLRSLPFTRTPRPARSTTSHCLACLSLGIEAEVLKALVQVRPIVCQLGPGLAPTFAVPITLVPSISQIAA
jgi:hypothetical protein